MRYTAPAGQAGLLSFRRAWKQVPLHELHNTQTEYITMKKTLITLLALAGAAVAGEEIALTLPASQQLSLNTVLASEWNTILGTVGTYDYGAYYGMQVTQVDGLNSGEGNWVSSDNVGAITMNGRDGKALGSAFVLVLGEELTQGTVITSISFSAKNKEAKPALGTSNGGAGGNVTLGLGIVDSEGKVLHSSGGSTINVGEAGNKNTQVLSLSNGITWQEGYKVIAVVDGVSGSNGGGSFGATPYTLENITVKATIPEPATATLSLLALAGLAARRRRK